MAGINVTAAQAADKWKRRLQASTEDIRIGVTAVTEAPTELAAQAADKYLAGVQAAVATGKYQRGLRRVSLQDWKDATLGKGLQRIASGAEAAVPKVTAFMQQLIPFEERLMAEVDAMPNLTLEDSIARMGFWARGMAAFEQAA